MIGQRSSSSGPLRLHVGAGANLLDGYVNIDGFRNEERADFFRTDVKVFARAEVLDAIYEPESVDEIRAHHVFEHISILDVDRTLRGWNRILKPGALLWIEVPDFEFCARRAFEAEDPDEADVYIQFVFGSQSGPGEFHKNGFTRVRLERLLMSYGFEVTESYTEIVTLRRLPVVFEFPVIPPLQNITVKAKKVGPPSADLDRVPHTHRLYRKHYPNQDLTAAHREASTQAGGTAAYAPYRMGIQRKLYRRLRALVRDLVKGARPRRYWIGPALGARR